MQGHLIILRRIYHVCSGNKTYLDDLRLRHAYNDLMNTDLSIGMVAEKNGFAGSKAFARVFKEQYGVLPSEYRKKN